ncbi:hypothetical protein C469_10621 [Halorubrum lipolyticum DSM 21995]|uniref:Uncharacterized protein n=2 Tax=Halorubrum lipolyticum TaxID=368624 RepID=M0NMB8_9EURY|nr:hypothetical protein C469_10621 [Halorubrum lipolyticum DSM 21995]
MTNDFPAAGRSPGPNVAPEGIVRASFAFLALIAVGVLVAASPLVSLVVLAGVVALGVLARSLARHVDRETVGRVSLPGLGTVEYRFTRS